MKALQAYVQGWSALFRYKRMWLLLYAVNFVLALLSAIPVNGFFGSKLRYSMSLGRSQPGFDYTFWGEVMQRFDDEINAILNQTILFLIIFFLLSIFMMGGILNMYKKSPDRFSLWIFWKGCSKYFWRLLRLTIYFLFIQALVLFLFFSAFSILCDGFNPFAMESEKQLMDTAMILVPIYVLVATLIAMVQDYAKIHLVYQQPDFLFKTFWDSFKIVFKNIGKFASLYLLNILTFLAVFGIFWLLSDRFNGMTMTAIFIVFVIGQLFILARIGSKLLNLSSATYLYQWTREGYNK